MDNESKGMSGKLADVIIISEEDVGDAGKAYEQLRPKMKPLPNIKKAMWVSVIAMCVSALCLLGTIGITIYGLMR